jgi:fucose permease
VASSSRYAIFLLPIVYLGFISLGLPDGTLGVAWPPLHSELNLPIGLAGTILVVATLLSGTAAFSSGRIITRFGTGPVVLVSCLLTGSALLMVSYAQNLAWLLIAAVPLGFGAGAVDAGLNGYVAKHYSGRHMNWLHACWGIGATCGPLVMARALSSGSGWRGGYLALGTVQLSLAVLFFVTLRLWSLVPERAQHVSGDSATDRLPTATANSHAGWLSVGIFATYVAVEMTMGLWASSILVEARGIAQESAALCAAAFYASITLGRIGVGFVVDRLGNRRLVAAGGILALMGGVLFAFAASTPVAALSLIMVGAGFAPIYPCLMHEVPRRFAPGAVQVVIGRQSGAAAIGAATLPALAGWIAEFSLNGIAWTIIAGIGGLIVALRRLDRIT